MFKQILKITFAILITISCAGSALAAGQFGYYPGTNHPFCPPLKDYKYTPKAYGAWDNSSNYNNFSGPHFGCRTQKAGTTSGKAPSITNFNNGATISKNQVVKFAKNGTVVNWWYLSAGSSDKNYYASGVLSGSATQTTMVGLPSGETIHIRLYHYGVEKKWVRRNYTVKTSGGSTSTLKRSGPITASKDGQVIQNYDIRSSDHGKCGITIKNRKNVTVRNVDIRVAGAGICVENSPNVRIETVRVVNTISQAGPHCRGNLSPAKCKLANRSKDPSQLYKVNSHNNITILNSPGARIDTVRLEKGESGVFVYRSSNTRINNIHCRDMRGPYQRGQCVMFTESHDSRLTRFYIEQFLSTSSGHDNVNFYNSDRGIVDNGVIRGNYSQNGVGVIADRGADRLTVSNVDMRDMGTNGTSATTGRLPVPNNFTAQNVRVRDGHCKGTWRGPEHAVSSGGLAFGLHKDSKNSRFLNSRYWNHCRSHAANIGSATVKDVKKASFSMKGNPTNIRFPWL